MAVDSQVVNFRAGEKRTLRHLVTDEDTTSSPPKNLAGLTIKWGLVSQDDAGDFSTTPLLVAKTSDDAAEILVDNGDGTNDRVNVLLVKADTTSLAVGDYHWQLTSIDGSSEEVLLASGTITLSPNLVDP